MTATESLTAISGRRHSARLRVPIEATGLRSFAKLRWGESVDTLVDAGATPETIAEVPVPCADAGAQPASARDCKLPFAAVTEIAECL